MKQDVLITIRNEGAGNITFLIAEGESDGREVETWTFEPGAILTLPLDEAIESGYIKA